MRAEGADVEITLSEEVEARRRDDADVGDLARAIQRLDVQVASDGIAKALAALAVERGYPAKSGTAPGVNEVFVHGRIIETASEPLDPHLGSHYSSIEGYKPQSSEKNIGSSAPR